MPVAEEPVYIDPNKIKIMMAEFPDHFPHPQRIPTEKEKYARESQYFTRAD